MSTAHEVDNLNVVFHDCLGEIWVIYQIVGIKCGRKQQINGAVCDLHQFLPLSHSVGKEAGPGRGSLDAVIDMLTGMK